MTEIIYLPTGKNPRWTGWWKVLMDDGSNVSVSASTEEAALKFARLAFGAARGKAVAASKMMVDDAGWPVGEET